MQTPRQALLKSLPGEELNGTLQLINHLHLSARGDRGRCPAAEPAPVAKSVSSDELGTLELNCNINTHLHLKVTCLQVTITLYQARAVYYFLLCL